MRCQGPTANVPAWCTYLSMNSLAPDSATITREAVQQTQSSDSDRTSFDRFEARMVLINGTGMEEEFANRKMIRVVG
ncbi:hypothetical protein GCM10009675_32660 [Prauserella alba]|uniref:Uncharacterized protein n=1 Tax=Prauserella alba TaxID=176898 RepID=A0ABN1VIU8_9PSEU